MSERIFGGVLLLVSLAGIWIGWDMRAPFSYEPVGPRAFPLLILFLLGLCALALMVQKRAAVADWAPAPVMVRIGLLFAVVLVYALLFDRLGFVLSTALMALPVARFFGGSWKQAAVGGIGLGAGLYILFDRLLDVALPGGLWLGSLLG